MGSLGGSPSDYNKLEENKNVHHYIDAIENTVDISQLNDMSFGEETHSINETSGSMPQIHGKWSPYSVDCQRGNCRHPSEIPPWYNIWEIQTLFTSQKWNMVKFLDSFMLIKVSKFQNEFIRSSFLPKYERKIVRISALCSCCRNLDNIFGEMMAS